MHPEQAEAIRIVSEGVDHLAGVLCQHYDLCEDDALDIVRNLPDLVVGIQAGDYKRLVQEAVKRVTRPKNLKFDYPDPDEKYPYHPDYRPKVTTPTSFNEHFSQAAKPYMTAILKRIAKDKGLADPDEKTVQAVMDNIDWAKAAYEARQLPESPTKQQLKRVFKRIWAPVEKVLDFAPFEWAWYVIMASAVTVYLFRMLRSSFGISGRTGRYYRTVGKVADMHEKWRNSSTTRWLDKGSRGWR